MSTIHYPVPGKLYTLGSTNRGVITNGGLQQKEVTFYRSGTDTNVDQGHTEDGHYNMAAREEWLAKKIVKVSVGTICMCVKIQSPIVPPEEDPEDYYIETNVHFLCGECLLETNITFWNLFFKEVI